MKKESDAYLAGFDCGLNGASITNCNFKYFATVGSKIEWERGKKKGDREKNKPIKLVKS